MAAFNYAGTATATTTDFYKPYRVSRTNSSSTFAWDEDEFNSAQVIVIEKKKDLTLPEETPVVRLPPPRLDRFYWRLPMPACSTYAERRWVTPPRGRAVRFSCKNFRSQK